MSQLCILDLVIFVPDCNKLQVFVLVHLVDIVEILELFELLYQIDLILVQYLLVGWIAHCILTDAFIKRRVYRVDVVLEGHLDELSPVLTDYLDVCDLLGQVELLPEYVSFVQLVDLYPLVEVHPLVLQSQGLVHHCLALYEEQDLGK